MFAVSCWGNFQQATALIHGCCQKTMSNVVAEVCQALAQLAPTFIRLPEADERRVIARGFFDMIAKRYPTARTFPNVIGAIAGTQINVLAHRAPNREHWRSRHGEIAMNILPVCDHILIFREVVVRWVGSTHDARIFRNSRLYGPFERVE